VNHHDREATGPPRLAVFNGAALMPPTATRKAQKDAEGTEILEKFSVHCLKHMALVQNPRGLLLNFSKRHIAREGLKRLLMSDTCR